MNRKIINLILTAVLVISLVTGSLFIHNFLPTYKNNITAHEDSDYRKFRYTNATDELNIYPWNEYDEDLCTNMQNPELIDTGYTFCDLLLNYISELFPEFIPGDIDEFSHDLYVDRIYSMYYLRDYTYTDIDGRACNVNAAFNYDTLEYLKCSYEDNKSISREEINTASEKIMNSIQYIGEWYYSIDGSTSFTPSKLYDDESEIYDENKVHEELEHVINPSDTNPINRFFSKFLPTLGYSIGYDPYVRHENIWVYLIDYSAIYYDHYFIISFNTFTDLPINYTLHIFYDPILDRVIGYSAQQE